MRIVRLQPRLRKGRKGAEEMVSGGAILPVIPAKAGMTGERAGITVKIGDDGAINVRFSLMSTHPNHQPPAASRQPLATSH